MKKFVEIWLKVKAKLQLRAVYKYEVPDLLSS